VRASYEALIDIFECVENFLRRLKIYTELPLTPAITEILAKIMVELLSVLSLATKQINQGRFSKSVLPLRSYSRLKLLAQRNTQRNCWERETLRQCCSDWTDSPWKNLGLQLRRHSTSSVVWSIIWKWLWKVHISVSVRKTSA
jgi:hypothetical protein